MLTNNITVEPMLVLHLEEATADNSLELIHDHSTHIQHGLHSSPTVCIYLPPAATS